MPSVGPELARLLGPRRLALELEPIRWLDSGSVARCEVLLRVVDREGRRGRPSRLLREAACVGAMRELDRWVIRGAVELLARSPERPDLSVNVSPDSLVSPRLAGEIEHLLESVGVEPSRLEFEITEEAAISDFALARSFVRRLGGLGCRFALDDFGHGFASLASLRGLPVHTMKIDGTFVRGLRASAVDRRLVPAMVAVAKALELETVAEHVRDPATARLLADYGVDLGQGEWAGGSSPA